LRQWGGEVAPRRGPVAAVGRRGPVAAVDAEEERDQKKMGGEVPSAVLFLPVEKMGVLA